LSKRYVWVLEPYWLDAPTLTDWVLLANPALREQSKSCAQILFGLSSCSAAHRSQIWIDLLLMSRRIGSENDEARLSNDE
jgi:hypothetical protein